MGHSLNIWVNEEDHLRLRVSLSGGQLVEAFGQFCQVESLIRDALNQRGHDYAVSEDLGYLTVNPEKLGTGGMRVGVVLKLPHLAVKEDLKALLQDQFPQATWQSDSICLVEV